MMMLGGGMLFGWLLLAGVVVLGVWLVQVALGAGAADRRAGGTGGKSTARQILEERFARGEIDSREFEDRKRELSQTP